MLATSASCGSDGLGFSRSILIESRAVFIVWTGDQLVLRISRQIAPWEQMLVNEGEKIVCNRSSQHRSALFPTPHTTGIVDVWTELAVNPGMGGRTVWLLTFGCQIFVSNCIRGGLKGYWLSRTILITYLPPSYGVFPGPRNQPLRVVSEDSCTGAAWMPELSLSSVKSCSSLIMRRSLLLDIVVGVGRDRGEWFQLESVRTQPVQRACCVLRAAGKSNANGACRCSGESRLCELGVRGAGGRVTAKAPASRRKKVEAEKAPKPAASQWRMAEDEGRQRLSTSGQTRTPTAGHHRFSGVRLNFAEACSAA